MGQKVHPKIQRIGIIYKWPSTWYAPKKQYAKFLHEDLKLEKVILENLTDSGVSHVEIERSSNQTTLNIFTAKPGLIIGRQGEHIEKLKDLLKKQFKQNFEVNIKEIAKPDLNARLIAENVAKQIEKRVSYRRACKMALSHAKDAGALGTKIRVGGRLNGVEIARNEYFNEGKIPLHTFRADIDYAYLPANTTYGAIGVKVWVYRGEIFQKKASEKIAVTEEILTSHPRHHETKPPEPPLKTTN